MPTPQLKIKLEFITGLKNIVIDEINQNPALNIKETGDDYILLDYIPNFISLINLKSVLRLFLIAQDDTYNPFYINHHKSILGQIISLITQNQAGQFSSFRLHCAGANSPEVRSIAQYISGTFNLREEYDADLKLLIVKKNNQWEVGGQITPRPLSVRDYKLYNLEGAIDPTIAYAVNSLSVLKSTKSYLNIFSGSATLLIEAGQAYPQIEKLIGFDNNKDHLSGAIKNIKKANLIHKIQLKEKDILDKPDLGKFDVITADPPFGMLMSKYEDLEKLYRCFIEYCQTTLNPDGILAVYTVKSDILKKVISSSAFKIIKKLDLEFMTASKNCLYPTIFICKIK